MTMREIIPIASLGSRPPEHGHLRAGMQKIGKNGKPYPVKLDTWRATSPDESAIVAIAEQYGGTPRPWNDPKANPQHQFEVITEAKILNVWLPDEALSCWYEEWAAGGCARRCDGVTVTVPADEGYEERPCMCQASQRMVCKPTSRLRVVLPGVEFGGVWRVESKGWNAAQELAAMEQMISSMQQAGGGLINAKLRLEERRMQRGQKVSKFMVPVLQIASTPQELVAGQASVTAVSLPTSRHLELVTGDPWDEPKPAWKGTGSMDDNGVDTDPPDDDEIIDAELVDDDLDQLIAEVLGMPNASFMSVGDFIDEHGVDSERRAQGLKDGSAKWNATGKIVRA